LQKEQRNSLTKLSSNSYSCKKKEILKPTNYICTQYIPIHVYNLYIVFSFHGCYTIEEHEGEWREHIIFYTQKHYKSMSKCNAETFKANKEETQANHGRQSGSFEK